MISEKRGKAFIAKKHVWLLLALVLLIAGGGVSVIVQAATQPRAWIASYADGRTSGLRASEMLEVKTSGFSPKAKLKYTYEWSNDDAWFPYNVMRSPDTAYYTYAYGDQRFVAIAGSKSQKYKLTVTVEDSNSSSPTYGTKVTTSYSKFKEANLSKDLSTAAYGMFVGEEETVLSLLGRGGVMHITCGNSSTKSCVLKSGRSVSLSGSGNETKIKAVTPGDSRCQVSVKKESGCAYHSGQKGSGEIIICVFGKPAAAAEGKDTITLTGTEKGVTYTVDGVSKTATKNGQELVFGGLLPDTTYKVECSKVIDGKKVATSFEKKTNGRAWVYFDNNRKGNTKPATQDLYVTGKVEAPTSNIPEAPGFYLDGWYTNPDGRGRAWNFENDTIRSTMTLYACWKDVPNTFNITLLKNEEAWTGQKIELYQGIDKKYELTENAGVYSNTEVINGTYDVYVNGENIYRPVTFATTATVREGGEVVETTLEYYSVTIKTTLDDKQSNGAGNVQFRQGDRVWNTFTNGNGVVEAYALKDGDGTSGSEYEIYIGDVKVRETFTATQSSAFELYFYKASLALTHDTAWTTATVTLRDEMGMVKHRLKYEQTSGTTTYYRAILQADDAESQQIYSVYVGQQDTHEVIKLTQGQVAAADYTKKTRFYEASVTVRTDDKADKATRVTVNNGVDTTQLLDFDGDGIYTENVLWNAPGGTELAYEVTVKNAIDLNPPKITMAKSEVTVDFYTINCHVVLGGQEIVNTIKARKGTAISSPASPVNNGRNMEGWYLEPTFETLYDFSVPVTEKADIYGKYEGQKVKINGYVKTDEAGTISGSGRYYTMPNLTISGFPNGDVMTGFILETSGCESIVFLPDDTLGEFDVIADKSVVNNELTIDGEGTAYIQFAGKITMKEMQTFLRRNVIVKPDAASEHRMQITVYGFTD